MTPERFYSAAKQRIAERKGLIGQTIQKFKDLKFNFALPFSGRVGFDMGEKEQFRPAQIIDLFDNFLDQTNMSPNDYHPIISLDECNLFNEWNEDEEHIVKLMLQYFVRITKQNRTAHVFLITTDPIVALWLSELTGERTYHFVIGTLSEEEIRRYYNQELRGKHQGLFKRLNRKFPSFDQMYALLGGHIYDFDRVIDTSGYLKEPDIKNSYHAVNCRISFSQRLRRVDEEHPQLFQNPATKQIIREIIKKGFVTSQEVGKNSSHAFKLVESRVLTYQPMSPIVPEFEGQPVGQDYFMAESKLHWGFLKEHFE